MGRVVTFEQLSATSLGEGVSQAAITEGDTKEMAAALIRIAPGKRWTASVPHGSDCYLFLLGGAAILSAAGSSHRLSAQSFATIEEGVELSIENDSGATAEIVKVLAPTKPGFHRADEAIGLLAFASSAYAGYTVLAIGIGRARRTQFNWIVTGAAAALNIGLNFWLIPRYGMMGAAISTAAAYVALFLGMTVNAQKVYPVAYQWRRVLTLSSLAITLTAVGFELRSLPVAIAFCVAYPLLLLPLGFYLPAERARLKRLSPLRL